MKRVFVGVSMICVLLTVLFLAGCPSPADPSDVTLTSPGSEGVPSISGPANLKAANDFAGLIRLTWNPVVDATGYDVYRRDANGVSQRINTGNTALAPRNNYYDDFAGFDNQLVAGASYTYTVVAYSGRSTFARLAVTDVVWNGESTVSITPSKMPEMYTDMPAIAGFTEDHKVIGGADYLVLTWDSIPTADYDLEYSIGTVVNGVDPDDAWSGNFTGNPLVTDFAQAKKGSYVFPLFGGINTVKITADYAGDTAYYNTVEASVTTEEYAVTTLDSPSNFAAVRQNTNDVVLTWDNNVTDAASYAIYRALIDDNDTIIGDWETVDVVYAEEYDDVNDQYQTVDDEALVENDYLYVIIAQNGDRKSAPETATIVAAIPFTTPDFSVDVRYGGNNTGRTAVVDVAWNTEEGLTYKLERAPITFAENVDIDEYTVPNTVGAYEEVSGVNYGGLPGRAAVVDSPSYAPRTSYRYRLVAIRDGEEAEPKYRNLVEAPFIDRTEITLTAGQHPDIPYAARLTFSDNSGFTADIIDRALPKDAIKVYRRISSTPETPFQEITATVEIEVPVANTIGLTYIDQFIVTDKLTVADYGDGSKTYEYKVIISGRENLSANANADLVDDTSLSAHAAAANVSLSGTPTSSGTNLTGVALNITGNRLVSSSWDVRYRYDNTNPLDSAWDNTNVVSGVAVTNAGTATSKTTVPFGLPNYTSGDFVEVQIRPSGSTEAWTTALLLGQF